MGTNFEFPKRFLMAKNINPLMYFIDLIYEIIVTKCKIKLNKILPYLVSIFCLLLAIFYCKIIIQLSVGSCCVEILLAVLYAILGFQLFSFLLI